MARRRPLPPWAALQQVLVFALVAIGITDRATGTALGVKARKMGENFQKLLL